MNIVEKILASKSSVDRVSPGEIVVVNVDTAVAVDLNFYDGQWAEPTSVFDPDKVVVIFDHVVPAPNARSARFLERGREFVRKHEITRFHDVGPDQGICHQLIADVPYAKAGDILVCVDSHTCSAGALNCLARGIGAAELIFVLAKGYTWFKLGTTVRYELTGELKPGVSAKDVFLHIASLYGDHVNQNLEIGGPGLASLTIDQRRTIATMGAEISADFVMFEPDARLEQHFADRGVRMDHAVLPDADAQYSEIRHLDLSSVQRMVSLPDHVVSNTVPISEVGDVPITSAFIGSCSNGTLSDLHQAAEVLRGRRVHPNVRLMVTPASQQIYSEALDDGTIKILTDAGALVTTSSCSMCAGHIGALGDRDVCISSSTRNFKGRMGSRNAQIYLASSLTVAEAAVMGRISMLTDIDDVDSVSLLPAQSGAAS